MLSRAPIPVATPPQRRDVMSIHNRLDTDGQTRTRVASLTPTGLTSVCLDGDAIHAETCQTSTRDEGECAGPQGYPRWACRTRQTGPVAPGYHQTLRRRRIKALEPGGSSKTHRPSRHAARHPRPMLYVPKDLAAARPARTAHAFHMRPARVALLPAARKCAGA